MQEIDICHRAAVLRQIRSGGPLTETDMALQVGHVQTMPAAREPHATGQGPLPTGDIGGQRASALQRDAVTGGCSRRDGSHLHLLLGQSAGCLGCQAEGVRATDRDGRADGPRLDGRDGGDDRRPNGQKDQSLLRAGVLHTPATTSRPTRTARTAMITRMRGHQTGRASRILPRGHWHPVGAALHPCHRP